MRTIFTSLLVLCLGMTAFAVEYHPADVNNDGKLTQAEINEYAYAYKTGQSWMSGPAVIPVEYLNFAISKWKNGELYQIDYTVTVTPPASVISVTKQLQLTANLPNALNTAVTWRVVEVDGGTVSESGLYTAPALHGVYHVEASSVADPSKKAIAEITFVESVVGTEKINPIDGATMIWVPSGTFTMGSSTGIGSINQQPAHQVTLSGYWLYKYEITVAQYLAFCTVTGHTLPSFPSDYSWYGKIGWTDPTLQQHPIVNVTWYDCKAYSDWAGVTLPSEAQWEYAARGPQGHNYPWGGTATSSDPYNGWDQSKCANYYNSSSQNISTWPVGSFPAGASWCGAQDMAGNVGEWCNDWYGNYSSNPIINPTGPMSGTVRVLRGFDWRCSDHSCRGAVRGNSPPNNKNYYFGFRCASPGQ